MEVGSVMKKEWCGGEEVAVGVGGEGEAVRGVAEREWL